MNLSDEIQKLSDLHRSGALSAAEFEAAKARLLQPGAPPPIPPEIPAAQPYYTPHPAYAPPQAPLVKDVDAATRQWAMFLHLSMLAGILVPFAGLVAPIVIWQVKKNELPGIDIHGVNAVNWIITAVIAGIVFGILCIVLIGIPLLIILGILGIVFPIIAAVKANEGQVWAYPMSFRFIHPTGPGTH
jgi:uncharacterized Tic20 family protein